MTVPLPRRPRLALPFTVLSAPGRVRLVAGEDFRFTLAAPGLESWFPDWLAGLDGSRLLEEALLLLSPEQRETARSLSARLAGERVLLEGPVEAAHPGRPYQMALEGSETLAGLVAGPRSPSPPRGEQVLPILVQDTLDLDEALRFNARCLRGTVPWLWLTVGPLARGYISPAFLPDAGPCLGCLLGHFRRLSPFPELYGDLAEHASLGRPFRPVEFPGPGLEILAGLLHARVEALASLDPPASLYKLHVLELATWEVSAHEVPVDPECPACRGRR